MKLEQIFDLWSIDSKIDYADLGGEALKISELHNKYFKILSNERLVLKKYESDYKSLKLAKYEFFLMGPTKETHQKGWELPPSGKVLKSDIETYIEADKDIVEAVLRIAIQKEKLELLESIIKTISNRNWNLRLYVDWEKFKAGIG